jgi:hypothetical protein
VGVEARTADLASQHREFVAQHENLDILGTIPPTAQHQQADHEPDQTIETGHARSSQRPNHADHARAKSQLNTPDEFSAPTRCIERALACGFTFDQTAFATSLVGAQRADVT